MQTHDKTNESYITVTVQYLDVEWNMKSAVLATLAVEGAHTGECIRTSVRTVLEVFGANRPKNVYVTDNAANIRAAFRDVMWQGCACHNLNLVLSYGLSRASKGDDAAIPEEIVQLIDTSKKLATLAKRTRINHSLETTLKQCVPTQWNSILLTLKSILMNLSQLRTLSLEQNTNKHLLLLMTQYTFWKPLTKQLIAYRQTRNLLSAWWYQ